MKEVLFYSQIYLVCFPDCFKFMKLTPFIWDGHSIKSSKDCLIKWDANNKMVDARSLHLILVFILCTNQPGSHNYGHGFQGVASVIG